MEDKIFPSILRLLEEDIKKMPFIDKLNRLEELGLVNRVAWMQLRQIRNDIAHEYSFNLQEVVDNLNDIYQVSETLLSIYDDLYRFCYNRFEFVQKSSLLHE